MRSPRNARPCGEDANPRRVHRLPPRWRGAEWADASRAQMLVLERDDSILRLDRQLLYQQVREHDCVELEYRHLRAHEEPLLAIPDAIAWCWQRGGPWRDRVRELVTEVRVV